MRLSQSIGHVLLQLGDVIMAKKPAGAVAVEPSVGTDPVVVSKAAKAAKKKPAKKLAKTDGGWAEKYRPGTIGRQIAEAILAGKLNNEEILADVKKVKTKAKTTYGCIAWYKSAARKAGVIK